MWCLIRFCSSVTLFLALWFLTAFETEAAVYTLTIQTNGSGAVSRNPTNSAYPAGAVVTVTALPDNGWDFSGWTGDESGNANPLNVTMTTNKFITATFEVIPTYML